MTAGSASRLRDLDRQIDQGAERVFSAPAGIVATLYAKLDRLRAERDRLQAQLNAAGQAETGPPRWTTKRSRRRPACCETCVKPSRMPSRRRFGSCCPRWSPKSSCTSTTRGTASLSGTRSSTGQSLSAPQNLNYPYGEPDPAAHRRLSRFGLIALCRVGRQRMSL